MPPFTFISMQGVWEFGQKFESGSKGGIEEQFFRRFLDVFYDVFWTFFGRLNPAIF